MTNSENLVTSAKFLLTLAPVSHNFEHCKQNTGELFHTPPYQRVVQYTCTELSRLW